MIVILEKLFLANVRGFISDLKNKVKSSLSINFLFPLVSLKTTRNNRSSPHGGPIKNGFYPKSLFLMAHYAHDLYCVGLAMLAGMT